MVGEALEALINRDKEVHETGNQGRETLKNAKNWEVELECGVCPWTGKYQYVDTRKEAGINAVTIARIIDHPQHADDIYVSSIKEIKNE